MPERTIGYAWSRREDISPHVLSSVELTKKPSETISRITHPCWVLDYLISRGEKYRVHPSRSAWELRLPRIGHLYPPGLPYWEDSRAMRGLHYSTWICFTLPSASALEKRLHRRRGHARFYDPTGELGEIIKATARAGQRLGEAGFWTAQSLLCRAINFLLQGERIEEGVYSPRPKESTSATGAFVKQVEDYMRAHLNEKVTLQKIARYIHTSPSTLSHRYRHETGEAPMVTFTRFRVEQAKTLIMRGLPLKAIAEHLGFSDSFHLSKTFKRVEGMSPKYFKRRYLSQDAK